MQRTQCNYRYRCRKFGIVDSFNSILRICFLLNHAQENITRYFHGLIFPFSWLQMFFMVKPLGHKHLSHKWWSQTSRSQMSGSQTSWSQISRLQPSGTQSDNSCNTRASLDNSLKLKLFLLQL